MSITPNDLGVAEDLGRRVLVKARIIAPCLDSFDPETEPGKNAIAILKGVIAELPEPGEKRIRSISRSGTSMTFDTALASAFEGDAADSLRSLCGASAHPGLPMGSFPAASPMERLWPEGLYT